MAAKKKQLIRFATDDGGYVFVDPETNKVVSVQKGNRRSLPADTAWAKDAGFAARQDEPGAPQLVGPSGRPLSTSKSNNRGNTIVFDPSLHVPSPLVDGTYTSEELILQTGRNGGEDAEDLCITLGREYVNEEAPFQGSLNGHNVTYHTALLEWGLGNATFEAEVDWDRGKTIVLCASYVQVIARSSVFLPNVAFNPNLPPIEALSAGLGYGRGSGSSFGLKLTKQLFNAVGGLAALPAGASSEFLEIPPFATHFGLVLASQNVASDTADALIVISNNANDEVVFRYSNISNTGGQGATYPIPSIRNRLVVSNTSADDWDRAYVIFGLAL